MGLVSRHFTITRGRLPCARSANEMPTPGKSRPPGKIALKSLSVLRFDHSHGPGWPEGGWEGTCGKAAHLFDAETVNQRQKGRRVESGGPSGWYQKVWTDPSRGRCQPHEPSRSRQHL